VYVTASAGCIPARPGGTVIGIEYVNTPSAVTLASPGIVPTAVATP
jgi:hypothetical protein